MVYILHDKYCNIYFSSLSPSLYQRFPLSSLISFINFIYCSPFKSVSPAAYLQLQGIQSSGLCCSLLALSTFAPGLRRGFPYISKLTLPNPQSPIQIPTSFLHWLQAIAAAIEVVAAIFMLPDWPDSSTDTTYTLSHTLALTHSHTHWHTLNRTLIQ